MNLLPLLISFAAGGMVAAFIIFWMVARTAPQMDDGIIEQWRETDQAILKDVSLTPREDRVLH